VRPRDLEGRSRVLVTGRVLVSVLVIALLGAGCRSHRARDDAKSGPDTIYQRAQKSMKNGDYVSAIKGLEGLQSRFPFSEPARQAQLDLIYVYYRSRQIEPAVDAADTFIRENPTNLRVDYAYYMKGLVYFERQPNRLERFFKADLSARPPVNTRKSFEAFAALIQKYPHSPYVADAQQRMVFLRNRLAGFELHVAEYYMRRSAYVGAINRAKSCIENYDGSPSVRPALKVLIEGYHQLKMEDLAASAERVYAANYGTDSNASPTRTWWGGHKASAP
jgi:outer membrane protein assembly factor BamD